MKKRLLALLLIVCFVMAIPCQVSAATATTVTQKKITIHKPGEEICTKVPKTYKEKGVARDSLGYRAYMYTSGGVKYGFVTCGHSLDKSTDNKVYAKDQKTVIGTIIETGTKVCPASSTLDYTFVELAKGHDVSDYTVRGKKLTGLGKPQAYTTVYREGRRTPYSYATISNNLCTSANGEAPYSGIVYSDLFWTVVLDKKLVDGGDSGGIAYNADGKVLGITSRYSFLRDFNTGMYETQTAFVRADSIQSRRSIYVAHSNRSISLSVNDNPKSGKVSLIWNGISNADKYTIYRRSDSGTFVYLTTVNTTNYDIAATSKGVVYEYLICGVTKSGEKVWSNTAQCGFDVTSKPTWKSISYNSNTGIPTLKWNAATGANKYAIFYSTKKDGTYKQLDAVTKTEYTHSKAEGGKTYYYRICAFNTNSKAGVYPLYSDRKSHTCTYAKPTGVEISRMSNGRPKVTWNSVSGATKYYVYRSTKKSSGFTNVATVTSEKSYSDNGNLNIGTTYYYKVRVANSSSTPYSSVVSCMCKYAKPSWRKDIAFSTGGKPKLEWNSVSGVSNYDVYYSTDNKNFKLLKSVKGTSYTHGDAKPGYKYYYKIKVSGSTGSDFSSVKSCRSN